jgi:hypothetical protein
VRTAQRTVLGADTALHFAAHGGHRAVCFLLLGAGASVGATNRLGQAPLHFARSKNTARVLLEWGGCMRVKDKLGRAPVAMARERGDAGVAAYLEAVVQAAYVEEQRGVQEAAAAREKRAKAKELQDKADEADAKVRVHLLLSLFVSRRPCLPQTPRPCGGTNHWPCPCCLSARRRVFRARWSKGARAQGAVRRRAGEQDAGDARRGRRGEAAAEAEGQDVQRALRLRRQARGVPPRVTSAAVCLRALLDSHLRMRGLRVRGPRASSSGREGV